jgi:hypothetical protein
MLGVLVLGFGGAGMTGACGSSKPREAESLRAEVDPPDPLAEAPLAIHTKPPLRERPPRFPPGEPIECFDVMAPRPCKAYRIPLLGNPHQDVALRNKYKAAFGGACYMSAGPIPTFDCFYKPSQMTPKGKACTDAQKIAEVFGAAPYDEGYDCQEVKGTKDWWLQVGPDPAIKIDIYYLDAPLETSLIDVNGVPTAINGPYRNLPEPSRVEVGGSFHCASGQVSADGKPLSQRKWILEVNRKAHGGVIHSDLAGFTWPCNEPDNPICTEATELIDKSPDLTKAAQVHHVVRAADLRGCKWGTNSNKNAVVISQKLNRFLWNKYPEANEVNWVNKAPPYTL